MHWVLRDPTRFLRERSELEQLYKDSDWLVSCAWRVDGDFGVVVDMDLSVHGKLYAVTLTYPDWFPETPAYIRPRDSAEPQWSNHQYGQGGTLCLEWRADNWQRNITGADLARSAYRLLDAERHPEQPVRVPSAHYLTEGQKLRSSERRLVCTRELLATLATIPDNSRRALRQTAILHIPATVAFISDVANAEGELLRIADLPAGVTNHFPLFAWPQDGKVFRSKAFDDAAFPGSPDELLNLLQKSGYEEPPLLRDATTQKLTTQFILLLGSDVRAVRALAINPEHEAPIQKFEVILPDPEADRLPVGSEKISNIRFGIVGMGSMGSKAAVSLARSGARRFLLVDDDYLAPHNICRNELSWAAVGTDKVQAVRDALKLIGTNLEVRVLSHRIAGQESALAAAAALKDLGACDVIIDMTADPEVFLLLAAIAKAAKKAMCWGEVFAGGIGGIIARARPGIDPNPADVRSAFLAHLSTLPPAPFQQATGYDVQSAQPLVAYDSEVGQIASALTRLILDTALSAEPSMFPCSVYMIGLRKAWIFSQPFDTYPIEVSGRGWDAEDADIDGADAHRQEAVQSLLQIIVKGGHADTGSSS